MGDHDHPGHDHEPPGRWQRSWMGNLISYWESYDASFGTKLGLTARNLTWGRVRHGVCCDHHGQPGC